LKFKQLIKFFDYLVQHIVIVGNHFFKKLSYINIQKDNFQVALYGQKNYDSTTMKKTLWLHYGEILLNQKLNYLDKFDSAHQNGVKHSLPEIHILPYTKKESLLNAN